MITFRTHCTSAILALTFGLVAPSVPVYCQQASSDAILKDAFDTDTGTWTGLGPTAKLEHATDAADVKVGKGSLRFRYSIAGKAAAPTDGLPIDLLLRPTPDGQFAKMQALGLWARSDIAAPFIVALSEKGGGRYVTIVWLPGAQWQHVTLRPADFWLSDDKNDPKDPDGKLDLDQVESAGLVNIWSFFAQSIGDSPESVAIFAPLLGAHTLLLNDFTIYSTAPALDAPEPSLPSPAKGIWIEDLRRDTLGWFMLGRADMRLDSSAPFKGRSIRLDYTQAQGQFVAFGHDLHRFNLAKHDRITFEVAATKSTKLVIQLEEKSGAKYNAIIDVPGDSQPTRKSISFSDFAIADDSPKDPDGQLDLDQLKTLTIVDITGAFGLEKQKNTLWIGPIRAITLNL